ncbi:uncharacterized protein LOC125661084 isoform X5 [Ostrea edulis]|nr:uncharacterized protein LOC125661084 isoform X5 [Ostrea edulis]
METLALKIICEDEKLCSSTTLNEIVQNINICGRSEQYEQSRCPYVVTFYSHREFTYSPYHYLCIEMEICDGGTLYRSPHHQDKYDDDEFRKGLLLQAISGLDFIHSCNLAHWDIKGDNIFFKSPNDHTIKYGDFGLTKNSTSSQASDLMDLGRTLLKHVFLRKHNLSGGELEFRIEYLLLENKVSKNIREALEGLTFGRMKLADAERKIKDIDGATLPTINTSSTESNICNLRTVKEVREVDPFYPKKSSGELLQPEDLIHFVIVYSNSNYTDVESFKNWFQGLIGDNRGTMVKLYDSEEFPADVVRSVKEIYNRAIFVLFYLTVEFTEDRLSTFFNDEGMGQTTLNGATTRQEHKNKYSNLALEHKQDCRRPIQTMPPESYETPVGLTTVKPIDYYNIKNQKEHLEKSLKELGETARRRFEDRKRAMFKCLYHENENKYFSSTLENSLSSLQTSAVSSLSTEDQSNNGDNRQSQINEAEEDCSMTESRSGTAVRDNDLEMVFDSLSRKLPGPDLCQFSILLLGDSTETWNNKYIPENYFRIMYVWKCKNPDINHKEKIKEVLGQMEREDLVDEMDSFSIGASFHHSEEIVGPTEVVDSKDFIVMCNNMAREYVHVVRFLGLQQKHIDQVECNFPYIKDRILQTLKKVKEKRRVTRQQCCIALHYADQAHVIDLLNKEWTRL